MIDFAHVYEDTGEFDSPLLYLDPCTETLWAAFREGPALFETTSVKHVNNNDNEAAATRFKYNLGKFITGNIISSFKRIKNRENLI